MGPPWARHFNLRMCVGYTAHSQGNESCGLLTKNIVGQDAAKALRIKFIEKLLEALDGVDYEHVQISAKLFWTGRPCRWRCRDRSTDDGGAGEAKNFVR